MMKGQGSTTEELHDMHNVALNTSNSVALAKHGVKMKRLKQAGKGCGNREVLLRGSRAE